MTRSMPGHSTRGIDDLGCRWLRAKLLHCTRCQFYTSHT
jgi:hypothetical protein